VGDLDVKAVHLVELDLETGDAAALTLAGFEFDQESTAVVLDRAQLIEVRVVAWRNHAAFAQQGAWFDCDGILEQGEAGQWRGERGKQFVESRRRGLGADYRANLIQTSEAVAQRGKITRAGIFQGNATSDALDVGKAREGLRQCGGGAVAGVSDQGRDGLVACGRNAAVGRRMVQAVAQPT
jgi:hypothetical protein